MVFQHFQEHPCIRGVILGAGWGERPTESGAGGRVDREDCNEGMLRERKDDGAAAGLHGDSDLPVRKTSLQFIGPSMEGLRSVFDFAISPRALFGGVLVVGPSIEVVQHCPLQIVDRPRTCRARW